MNNVTYKLLQSAKKNCDLFQMKELYEENKNNCIISFEYAKLLIKNEKDKEAKEILLSLLNTRNKNYAKLELGKLEFRQGKIESARSYFEELLSTSSWAYAMLELGRLEFSCGNIDKARGCFKELLDTSNWAFAMLELGGLEYSQGNTEKARGCFEKLLTLNSIDKLYAITNLVKISIKQNDYLNAFKYFTYLKGCYIPKSFKVELDILKLYIMLELNVFFGKGEIVDIVSNYTINQALDYDEFVAVERISEMHKSDFSTDIDISRLFNDIKNKLVHEYKVKSLSVNDVYDIPYENIGENSHVLRVVTLPNSKDILTMHPLFEKRCNLNKEIVSGSKLRLQRKK